MVGENRYRVVGTFPEGHSTDEGDILYEEIERQMQIDTEMKLNISHVNWFSVYRCIRERSTSSPRAAALSRVMRPIFTRQPVLRE